MRHHSRNAAAGSLACCICREQNTVGDMSKDQVSAALERQLQRSKGRPDSEEAGGGSNGGGGGSGRVSHQAVNHAIAAVVPQPMVQRDISEVLGARALPCWHILFRNCHELMCACCISAVSYDTVDSGTNMHMQQATLWWVAPDRLTRFAEWRLWRVACTAGGHGPCSCW